MADTVILGFEIHDDSEAAKDLVECVVKRLTGHPMVDPDDRPGFLNIPVQAEPGTDMPANAERLRDECAAELGIDDPGELVSILRP